VTAEGTDLHVAIPIVYLDQIVIHNAFACMSARLYLNDLLLWTFDVVATFEAGVAVYA
jgi:hypothetical protein